MRGINSIVGRIKQIPAGKSLRTGALVCLPLGSRGLQLKRLLWLAALLVSPAAFGALATEWAGWEYDFDEEQKSWKEIQAQIPAFPKEQNLILLEAGSETAHRFYVDAASVSVGADGVVRYTTVIKTTGGARNVTFEGMRCETREGKLYALGRTDGTWSRARNPRWQRIVLRDLTPHHYVLYREYFCPSPARATAPKLAVEALRRGVGLATSPLLD